MAAPTAPIRWITVGVDTHKDRHVAAAVDQSGRMLASTQAPTTVKGCKQLLAWAQTHGRVDRFGIEGTGAYGAGLARFLRAARQQVVEVDRPNRQTRRRQGKSDPLDAEAAARAALAGTASGSPKARDGAVEAIRALRVARRSALKARTQAANQLDALVISAPEPLRGQLRALATAARVARVAALRCGQAPTDRLCGAAPLEASSGRTRRHRLNRGGDRQANNALWRIVLVRMHYDPRTKAYLARRTAQGLSKREIIRCFIGRVSAV